MTLRRAASPAEIDAAAQLRRSVRVGTAAEILDCHPSQVRDLINDGTLEAHGIGVRGVRIFVDSIEAYQEAQRRPAKGRHVVRKPERQRLSREHHEAMAYLRSQGVA